MAYSLTHNSSLRKYYSCLFDLISFTMMSESESTMFYANATCSAGEDCHLNCHYPAQPEIRSGCVRGTGFCEGIFDDKSFILYHCFNCYLYEYCVYFHV